MRYLPLIIPASLLIIAFIMLKFSKKPDPRDSAITPDPTDITIDTHYDFRGNKSHHLN